MDLVESGIRHHFLPVPPSPCPPLTSFEKNLLPIFVADRFQAMLLKEGKIPLPPLICWLVYGGTTSTGHLSVLRGFLFQKIWGLLSMITLIEDVIKCGVWPGLAPGFMELRQGGSAWTWLYCSHSVCGGSVASERHSVVLQWKSDWLGRLQASFACSGWPEAILQAQGSCTMSRQKALFQSKERLWFREMWNLFERSFFKKTCSRE